MKGPTTAAGEPAISIRVQAILLELHTERRTPYPTHNRAGDTMGALLRGRIRSSIAVSENGGSDSIPFDRKTKHRTLQEQAMF